MKRVFSSFSISLMIVVIVGLIFVALEPVKAKDYVEVSFFDVGQGDAALITTPQNQNILIDGGPDNAVITKLDKKIPFYHKDIDAIILTHPHSDHLVGLLEVVEKYNVKNIYMTGVIHTTSEYIQFLEKIKNKNIPTKIVKTGDMLELGEKTKIYFLYPKKNLTGQRADNLNDTSIVAKLVFGDKSVLFTGDLEDEGQADLLGLNQNLKSDVLKVSHHGSKNGTTKAFLSKILPSHAIISVGKGNNFGHPSQIVLNLLKSAKLYRTDQDGDVTIKITENDVVKE